MDRVVNTNCICNNKLVTASAVDQRAVNDKSRYYYLEWQGPNGRDYIGSHLALACNLVYDPSGTEERQQVGNGFALANLLFDQRSDCIEIAFGDKTRARINLQTREMIYLAQAKL